MLVVLAIFTITARESTSTVPVSVQTFSARDPLQNTPSPDHRAVLVRRHEALSEHLLEANRSFDSMGSEQVVFVAANGDSSVHSPNGGGPLAQTFDAGRPAVMVRRQEAQGKHIAEVAANGESSIQSLLSHTLDVSRPAAVVRRHESQSKLLAEVVANSDNLIQSSIGRNTSAHTWDDSRPAAVVRRHETQTEQQTEAARTVDSSWNIVAGTLDSSIYSQNGAGSLVQALDSGHPVSMVRRRENRAEVAANDDEPIQSSSELDNLTHIQDAGRSPAMVRRHESQDEHRAKSNETVDVMRSRRIGVVVTTNVSTSSSGSALTASGDPLLALPWSVRFESPEHVSVHGAPMSDPPRATFNDFTVISDSSSSREDTPGQMSRRNESQVSLSAVQPAPLWDAFSKLPPHSDVQSEKDEGVRGSRAGLNNMSPNTSLAHASVATNATLTSQPVAGSPRLATLAARTSDALAVASIARKTNVSGLGPVLGAVLAEAQTSAVQQPVTTTAPVVGSTGTAAPADNASTLWSSLKVVYFIVLIFLCGLGVILHQSFRNWAEQSSDRPRGRSASTSRRRSSSEHRSRETRSRPGYLSDAPTSNAPRASVGRPRGRFTPPETFEEHVSYSQRKQLTALGGNGTHSSPLSRWHER